MWTANESGEGRQGNAARVAMLQRVISELHSCSSHHLETVHVMETFLGRPLWEGDVEVFSIRDHARAQKCFAWVKRIGKRKRVRFFAVLANSVVRTPLDAVKFAHVANSSKLIQECSKLVRREGGRPSLGR
jgi:hypothetical protein